MPGALDGVAVLDLSWGIAGPLAVMQLADHGADVVKVEPPGGDPFRAHPGSPVWHRGRRSVALDLKGAGDRARFLDLVDRADVLVESFRPGVMSRLGLDHEALAARNPRLVFCSITGYPPGHRAAHRPGYDALVQARSGQQWEQPGWRDGPIFVPMPLPSMGAQFLAQIGITAALLARERTGRGQHVETSLYQGVLLFTTMLWQHAERADAGFHGVMAKTSPPGVHQASLYECADDRWIHAAAMSGLQPTATQDEVLGIEDGPDALTMMGMSPEERAAHDARVREAFRHHDRNALVDALHAASLGAEAVVAPAAMFDHPQLQANGTFARVDDPEYGPTLQVGAVISLEATPGAPGRPRPLVGEHTEEVFSDPGWTAPHAASPPAEPGVPHALEGVTVLDFGQYLAGPFGPMILADLGADVIKVEPVTGDAMRFVGKPFAGCQRGKRCIAVDLKTDEGREIAYRLVERADVVHHNMTKGTAARLSLDGETLRARNPGLVYCNTYAYGEEGPLSHFGGLDPLYQAAVGLEYDAGPVAEGNPPLYYRFGMCDTANALASVQAVLLALYHRARTGVAQSVTTSLLSASTLYTSDVFVAVDGGTSPPPRPALDKAQTGLGALYRLYETQEGWLQVAAVTDAHWRALASVLGRPEWAEDERFATHAGRAVHRSELEGLLEPLFRARSARAWSLVLDDAGVPAEVSVDTLEGEAVLFDADNVALGLVTEYDQPRLGRLRQFGTLIGFSDTPGRIERPPPMVGQHTREIMGDLGYDGGAIAGLLERKVVYEPDDAYWWGV
jgi:crotonobetainyl-CoA:carnitine CoA-transferase CaiB-like acyl-CoA transferase